MRERRLTAGRDGRRVGAHVRAGVAAADQHETQDRAQDGEARPQPEGVLEALGEGLGQRPVVAAGCRHERVGARVGHRRQDGQVQRAANLLPMMMCAFGKIAALEQRGSGPPNVSWKRYLTIMLDGLRAR